MFKSKEIRWFTEKQDRIILEWFESKGLNFENTESRTDFYLPLEKDDLNIKLREGNIEVKHRIRPPEKGRLTASAHGIFEEWIKWSFAADQTDRLSHEIITERKYSWTETVKTRIGVKIKINNNDSDKYDIVSIKDFISSGCQVEYTKIMIHNKVYYTFAFEWFGNPFPDLSESFLAQIPGDAVLKPEVSMGYARFLNSLHH
jgi:hypothetical protein